MTGNRFINTGGGNYNERIEGDYIQAETYYAAGQPQTLAEAAAEIQELLEQLQQSYPATTPTEQTILAREAAKRIEANPQLKQRIIKAIKVGGVAALVKLLDNPAGAFLEGALEGWQAK